MLILPVNDRLDWKKPPLVTALLVVLNVLVFFIYQSGDGARVGRAMDFYFSSGLAQQELPVFLHKPDLQVVDRPELRLAAQAAQYDEAFQRRVQTQGVISPKDAQFAQWRDNRQKFVELQHQVSFFRFGFIPAEHRAVTWLSSMFLHGDLMHLVGNMVFLFVIGFVLEKVIGAGRMALFYLIGGFGALALFWLVQPDSGVPLVGASGAISGIMGMYTVVFWTRRIDFFYWAFVYVDYVKAPAIILLPVWVGLEIFHYLTDNGSGVAYMAHLGGLLTGAGLGLWHRRQRGTVTESHFAEEDRQDRLGSTLEQVTELVKKLELDRARQLLEGLLVDFPGDIRVLGQLYNVVRHRPQHPDCLRVAQQICALPGEQPPLRRLVIDTWADAQRRGVSVEPHLRVRVAQHLLALERTDEAEQVLTTLASEAPQAAGLPGTLLMLAKARLRENNQEQFNRWVERVIAGYPDSREAGMAKDMLQHLNR